MLEMEVLGVQAFVRSVELAPEVINLANREAMELSVRLVESEAKARVPRRTGRLFSSIDGRVETLPNEIEGRVGTDVEYARAVEFGATAHDIVPSMATVLAFDIGGQHVFARKVRHPGTKPRPYMAPALEASEGGIKALFRAAAARLVKHLSTGGAP